MAQFRPLPEPKASRRADVAYLDSLRRVYREQYQLVGTLPRTPYHDTLQLRALYQTGRLYWLWGGRRDSVVHYASELIGQARRRKNLFYELNGKLLLVDYYRAGERNTPEALRLSLDILARLPDLPAYRQVRFRANLSIGRLYTFSKQYDKALAYMIRARQLFSSDSIHRSPVLTSLTIDLEQQMGEIANRQGNFLVSEAHLREAERLLVYSKSPAEHGYVYDDLAELYQKYNRHAQALQYAKRAEAIWEKVRPAQETKSWGTLACIYADLQQPEPALLYARRVLASPYPSKFIKQQAYLALYHVARQQQRWQEAVEYHSQYVAVRDTITADERATELVAIEKQTEYDRLALDQQQARQLQAQQLITVQKQAELDRLRAQAQTDALHRRNQLAEQQRQLDNQHAQLLLTRQQTRQQRLQQQLREEQLQQQNALQRNRLTYLGTTLLFLTGVWLLLLYSLRLRKRRAEAELQLSEARQLATRQILIAQETERQRIAADLHDDLGGTLATLHLRLADLTDQQTDPQARAQLAALQPIIRQSSHDLRRIAHNLMPPAFAQLGLRAALEQLVRSQPPQPTRFTFITAGTPHPLPLDVELNAYRIVSELVQNIHKHAHASRADIQLLYHDTYLNLTVEDDGVGDQSLDLANGLIGIGLKNSSLRAEYIGATLRREVSGRGTLVVLDVPYLTTPDDRSTARPPAAGR